MHVDSGAFHAKIQHAQQARPCDRDRHCAFSRAQRAMLLARLAPGVCFRCLLRGYALLRYFGRDRGATDDTDAGHE